MFTSPSECSLKSYLDFFTIFVVKMAIPVVFLLTMTLYYGISRLIVKWLANHGSLKSATNKYRGAKAGYANNDRKTIISNLGNAFIRSILMLSVMFYVPMCQFTLQFFDCTSQPDGTWTLNHGTYVVICRVMHRDIN